MKLKLPAARAVFTVMAVMVLVSSLLFTACTKRESGGLTIKQGVLMIGMDIDYPPMEYVGSDGVTPMGFDVDLGKAIAERLGLTPEFIDTAWDGIFASVETQRFDIIMSSVTITDARLATHNFSNPYVGNAMAIVTRKDSAFKPRSPQQLQGLGVSFQAETTAKFFMERLEEGGLTYTILAYDTVTRCFDELQLGRVDVIVTDGVVAGDYAAPADSVFEITWVGEPDEFFGIVIAKGNDALTDAINGALEDLFNNGTMRRISMEHLGADFVSPAREQW